MNFIRQDREEQLRDKLFRGREEYYRKEVQTLKKQIRQTVFLRIFRVGLSTAVWLVLVHLISSIK